MKRICLFSPERSLEGIESMLISEGIDYRLQPLKAVNEPFHQDAGYGRLLQVAESDYARARELLEDVIKADNVEKAVCPQCHSLEVVEVPPAHHAGAISALFNAIAYAFRRRRTYVCADCAASFEIKG
jgi:hypothetical protein